MRKESMRQGSFLYHIVDQLGEDFETTQKALPVRAWSDYVNHKVFDLDSADALAMARMVVDLHGYPKEDTFMWARSLITLYMHDMLDMITMSNRLERRIVLKHPDYRKPR